MHSDSKKRRSFLTLLFAAGDVWRYRKKPDSSIKIMDTLASWHKPESVT